MTLGMVLEFAGRRSTQMTRWPCGTGAHRKDVGHSPRPCCLLGPWTSKPQPCARPHGEPEQQLLTGSLTDWPALQQSIPVASRRVSQQTLAKAVNCPLLSLHVIGLDTNPWSNQLGQALRVAFTRGNILAILYRKELVWATVSRKGGCSYGTNLVLHKLFSSSKMFYVI